MIEIDHVIGVRVDVVGLLVNERTEGRELSPPVPLQHHPHIGTGPSGTTGSRNYLQKPLWRRLRWNARGCCIADNGDQRGSLIDQRHNDLRLDSTILERLDDGVLEFDRGPAVRANVAGVGNRYVAIDVDGLAGTRDKIARANAGLRRDEDPA